MGTDAEWESAAQDLDRFVMCASALFERFVSTGMIPDHPLLGGTVSGEEGDVGPIVTANDSGSRGSPGIGSPDSRSPWALSHRLGPSTRAVRRRRASISIWKSPAKEGNCLAWGKNNGAGGEVLGGDGKDEEHRIPATGSCGSLVFASPPRARARSARAVVDGHLFGKARRLIVNDKTSEDKGILSITTSRQKSTEDMKPKTKNNNTEKVKSF